MRRLLPLITGILLLVLVIQCLFVPPASARTYLFNTSSEITLSSDHIDIFLIDSQGQEATWDLFFTYTYGRAARPAGWPFPNKKMPTTINITITEQPSWCIISLDRGSFEVPLSTFLLKKNQSITFSVNLSMRCIDPKTPAFQKGPVRLAISSAQNGNVGSSSMIYDFMVAPSSFLSYDAFFALPVITMEYGEEKNATLTVKNTGNNKTVFNIESTTTSDLLNISFDQNIDLEGFTLDIDEEKEIMVHLRSLSSENNSQLQKATFNISSYAAYNPSVHGPKKEIGFQVSLIEQSKPQGNESFDGVMLFVYLAIIVIFLPVIVLVILHQKKKGKTRR